MSEEVLTEVSENPFVGKFETFLKVNYQKDVERLAEGYPERRSLEVDFHLLEQYDYELADELLDNPDYLLKAAEEAVSNIDVPALEVDNFKPHVRFFNLPKDAQPLLRDLGSKQLNKMISVEGVVGMITQVMPKLRVAVWKCKRCDTPYEIIQSSQQLRKPAICDCKHRDFELVTEKSKFIDSQKVQIQEPLENLKGSEQPTTLDIYLTDDMVNRISPGDRTKLTGVLRLYPGKDKKVVYERYLESLHLEETAKEFDDVEISREEEEEIKKLASRGDVYDMLIGSIGPAIYGHEAVKEAVALQLFGGIRKTLPGDTKIRGNIHVLLVGDPGVAKSMMLLETNKIAPKSVYIAGKTATGAGISATAVKDDFGEGGWTIKAGALVLANGGVALIDEFDKMDPEDRSAMHEALEQQSYDYGTMLLLSDGSEIKIGDFVENLFEKHKGAEVGGKDCLIMPYAGTEKVLTTDFEEIYKCPINRVSKHKAPEKMVKIDVQNGRSITVTPEHPCFTVRNGEITTVTANEIGEGDFVPLPNHLPIGGEVQHFEEIGPNEGKKEFKAPLHNSAGLCRFVGYLLSDGGHEMNRGKINGVCLSNKNNELITDFSEIAGNEFGLVPHKYTAKSEVINSRLISKDLVRFLKNLDERLVGKGKNQRIPPVLMGCRDEEIREILKGLFAGDGSFTSSGAARASVIVESEELAGQVQTVLLRFGIQSIISREKTEKSIVFKVGITGIENLRAFSEKIGFGHKDKDQKLAAYLEKQGGKKFRTLYDFVPNCGNKVSELCRKTRLLESKVAGETITTHKSGKTNFRRKKLMQIIGVLERKVRKTELALMEIQSLENPSVKILRAARIMLNISRQSLADAGGFSRAAFCHWERKEANAFRQEYLDAFTCVCEGIISSKKEISKLRKVANPSLRWVKVVSKEEVKPSSGWVYDVTIEPNHTFISHNMILHNTVSVAKAGIVARFKTETSVLAAANPKFSRFDPYQNFIEQINLPPTLISRFDLFFMIRDVLEKDGEITNHMLKSHQAGEMMLQENATGKKLNNQAANDMKEALTPKISGDVLKKYISFARQNIFPIMNDEAMKDLSEFYLGLRDMGRKEGGYAATARQLEALIRLSEASARIRLSNTVDKQDTERAIRIFRTSMQELATDKETGRIDIDLITTGQSHSKVENMRKVMNIIREKAADGVDMIPVVEIVEELSIQGIEKEKVRELINKLKKAGDLYEPRHGFLKPTQRG